MPETEAEEFKADTRVRHASGWEGTVLCLAHKDKGKKIFGNRIVNVRRDGYPNPVWYMECVLTPIPAE